jgi:Amt family ammonium transporter
MSRSNAWLLGGLAAAMLLALGSLSTGSLRAEDEPPAAAAAEAATATEPAPAESKPDGAAAPEEGKGKAPAAAFGLNETEYALDNMMLFVAAVLVLFMQAGFSLVETGLNASKNAVNIMFKNVMDLGLGVILFFLIGYGLMYPGQNILIKGGDYSFLGFGQVGIADMSDGPAAGTLNPQVDFLFQVAFCATAATIVSGAVAGRIKFIGYLIYTAIITGLIYPISGMWKWGEGFLHQMGFVDFAGSVVVHAVGGFAGLAGAMVLGARLGRFVNGKSVPMPGHNIPFAALGVFILWIGWYGFNPGSQLAFTGQVNTDAVMKIATNTTLAAAAGAVAAMILSWVLFKKPDLTMALNGVLGGLVGITANCDIVTNFEALFIGLIAGVVVTMAIVLLDKLQIDDPVGAFPVHGACGIWGGLATGLLGDLPENFSRFQFIQVQAIGTLVICAWALGASLAMFYAMRAAGVLRVSPEEELAGLDISEHGMYAYPQQQVALETYGGGTPLGSNFGHASPLAVGKPSTEAAG